MESIEKAIGAVRRNEFNLSDPQLVQSRRRSQTLRNRFWALVIVCISLYLISGTLLVHSPLSATPGGHLKRVYDPDVVARCHALNVIPAPEVDFHDRTESDRYVPGTPAVLIKNATIWTGSENGQEYFAGDVLIDKGIINWVGNNWLAQKLRPVDLKVVDAKGAWLTPGIIDVHSHLTMQQAPRTKGASAANSFKGASGSGMPWLRSLDGFNTHDDAMRLAVAGGLTTSLILPGSVNAIGGQAFAIKLRPTHERSPTSFLLEPPYGLNGSRVDYTKKPRWRQMKHACGENPSRVYQQSRMDVAWDFRKAYNKAREVKDSQDAFCEKVLAGKWDGKERFPDDLQWEAAVDVLRGKVKVHTHCYEAVDLDNFVRLSNEFKFPVEAFHHAHETYLVPDVLRRAYGNKAPASAMFATFSRYKRESYRHSEFAPRILHDAGLRVVMKSDHPAIVSRYLLHEAQQAYYYGLPWNIALASVTSTAADVLGYSHRIGYIREGYDADLVLWDSHPLQIGATPVQVFIDGTSQLDSPYVVKKPKQYQSIPRTPNFDKERERTIKYEGLPPLGPERTTNQIVTFTNVGSVLLRSGSGSIIEVSNSLDESNDVVVVQDGQILCTGREATCRMHISASTRFVDLQGGSICPGLMSYGTGLGLVEITDEESTTDGTVYDAFSDKISSFIGGDNAVIRAVDGLIFSTRNALLAYREGVTSAITAPASSGFLAGLSTYFSTGAAFKIENGAVLQDVTALHFTIHRKGKPSIGTQIAALRRLLTTERKDDLGYWTSKVLEGEIPLVIEVHSADEISTLLELKREVEEKTGVALRLTLTGASEAHLLAKEIGEAGVGIIVDPVRPYPDTWEKRRILPGPPLSQESAVLHLIRNNVTVGIGVAKADLEREEAAWAARNSRFDVSWLYIETGGHLSRPEAIALASSNTEQLLGVHPEKSATGDLVATRGGDLLNMSSKVVGVISPSRQRVELFCE